MAPIVPRSRLPLVVAAAVASALLTAFGLLADEVLEGDTVAFDRALTLLLRENGDVNDPLGPRWLEEAARDLTSLGSFSVLAIVVALAAGTMLAVGRRTTALYLAFATLAGTIISQLLKAVFDRPRPDVEAATHVFTASFPSGHSMLSAVVYLTIAIVIAEATDNRRLRILYLCAGPLLSVIVGLSRVYIGVHYPTDVLAGWSLGAAWALLCWIGAAALRLGRGHTPSEAGGKRAPP